MRPSMNSPVSWEVAPKGSTAMTRRSSKHSMASLRREVTLGRLRFSARMLRLMTFDLRVRGLESG